MTERTKAIIAVDYCGITANTDPIREYFNGFILEDCAWSSYTPGAGTKGDAAVWSFQAVKTMSSGDGGIITTNDEELNNKLRPMINFGIPFSTYERAASKLKNSKSNLGPGYTWDFNITSIGYKGYMSDITAAICLAQLEKLDDFLDQRRHVQKSYNDELGKLITIPEWSETAPYYPARVQEKDRDALMIFLASKNIHTTIHYKPLHLHPIFEQDRDYPVTDSEWKKFISLPCHAAMKDEDIDYVVHWVKEFFKLKR